MKIKIERRHLASPTERAKLKGKDHRPYFLKVAKGIACGWLPSKKGGAGSWRGRGPDLKEFFVGNANDAAKADGINILDLDQAIAKTHELLQERELIARPKTAGTTLRKGFEVDYAKVLAHNGKDPLNAATIKNHIERIAPEYLDMDPIAVTNEQWRKLKDRLLDGTDADGNPVIATKGRRKGKPVKPVSKASWNRQVKCLCACLNVVAPESRDRWQPHLKVVSRGAGVKLHRNVVITPVQRAAWIVASYEENRRFGLYMETVAETGARPDQVARIRVGHLYSRENRITCPRTGKGREDPNVRREELFDVYVSPQLTAKLVAAAKGRAAEEFLFVQDSGRTWVHLDEKGEPIGGSAFVEYEDYVVASLKACSLERNDKGEKVSLYALRHTLITERIKGVKDENDNYIVYPIPTLIVADAHDTGVAQIEKHYAAEIGKDPAVIKLLRATIPGIGHNGGPPLEEIRKAA